MSEISRYYAGCGVLQTPMFLYNSEVLFISYTSKELSVDPGAIAPFITD